jgi:hypothetical protein
MSEAIDDRNTILECGYPAERLEQHMALILEHAAFQA